MQLSLEDDVFAGTHGRQGIAGTTFSHDIMQLALTSLAPIIVLWAVLQNRFCFPVVRMSWHTPPSLLYYAMLSPPVGFSLQLLDRGHHPYISTGFGRNHFYSLVSVLFMECQ